MRRLGSILSILFCLVLFIFSGCSTSGSGTIDTSYYKVEGTIANVSSEPLSNVECTLQSCNTTNLQESWKTTSGSNGGFEFSNIPDGRYKLVVEKDEYITTTIVFYIENENKVINVDLLKNSDWDPTHGSDHPYDPSSGVVSIQVDCEDSDTNTSSALVSVDLTTNKTDGASDYEDVGYQHPDGHVDWDASSTYDVGVAVFYKVNPAKTYTASVTRSGFTFKDITDVTPKAGEIVKYIVTGTPSGGGAPTGSGIPVKIINNSKVYSDNQIYIVVCGRDLNDNYYYYDFQEKKMVLVTDKPANKNYYTTLSSIGSADNRYYYNPTDNLNGGRIYISLGKPVNFHVNNNDPTQWATPDFNGTDKYTIQDKVEFDCDTSHNKLTINTTCVDFFGIAFNVKLTQTDGTTYTEGFNITKNSEVTQPFEDLASDDIWKSCLIQDTNGNTMRILAPNKFPGTEDDNPFKDYLTATINNAWVYYKTHNLNVTYSGWTYTGSVDSSGNFNITCTQGTTTLGTESIPQPSSYVVLQCDGYPLANSGADWSKKLHALIGATLNRGVMVDSDWGDSSKYYQSATAKYNYYSKMLHEKALSNKCYAFGYDDVYKQDPTQSALFNDVHQVTITIPEMPTIKK